MPSRHSFLSVLKELADKTKVYMDVAKGILGAGIVALAIGWFLHFVSRFHWVLGAALAVLIVVAAIWLIHQVKGASRQADVIGVLSVLALGLFTIALVCAWISFTLHVSGVGIYEVPAKYSPGTFFDFYMYTFIDLLPGIKAIETLHLKTPIESQNFVTGLPILGFKLFVIYFFFDVFISWRKAKQDSLSAPQVQRSSKEES